MSKNAQIAIIDKISPYKPFSLAQENMKRKQLTLFLDEDKAQSIESIRQRFNPKQYKLIKSHITLLMSLYCLGLNREAGKYHQSFGRS